MRQIIMYADLFWSRLPSFHKVLSLVLTALVLFILFTGERNSPVTLTFPNITTAPSDLLGEAPNNATLALEDYFYTIAKGDTLGYIFDQVRIPQSTMYEILETDLAI